MHALDSSCFLADTTSLAQREDSIEIRVVLKIRDHPPFVTLIKNKSPSDWRFLMLHEISEAHERLSSLLLAYEFNVNCRAKLLCKSRQLAIQLNRREVEISVVPDIYYLTRSLCL